ncbi:MAG: TetR/AcrR family transcriptional regulator [Bacillota bacterium]
MHPKQEKIIAAATKLFSKQGASETTMKEIAAEASVGKGTLYRYFENKEDLTSSLVKTGFRNITAELKAELITLDKTTEKIEKAIESQLEYYGNHRDFCRFLTREFWGYKNKFEENIKEIRNTYTVVIEEIINTGIEEGTFKDVDPEVAAVSLVGVVNITALHWFMFKDEFPVDKIKKEIIEIYFNGILS